MGCPSQAILGESLTFSICTHNANTAQLTDADELPTFRIYEDGNNTAIATGTMQKVDDDNTVGLYQQTITCTTADGYTSGNTYTIYVEATVDSITGGIAFGFRALSEDAYWENLIAAIRRMMANVEVRPRTQVLGPCARPVKAMPAKKTC